MVVKMKMVHYPFGLPPPKVMSEAMHSFMSDFLSQRGDAEKKTLLDIPKRKKVQQQFFHIIKVKKKMSKKKSQ